MKRIMIGSGVITAVVFIVFISTFFMADEALMYEGQIPPNIGAYELTAQLEGNEAVHYATQSFGRDIPVEEVYVLEFQTRGGSFAIVHVLISEDGTVLEELLDEKREMISANANFSNMIEKVINDRKVEFSSGNDRDHYFFISGDRYVWVETYDDTRDRFIQNAVRIFGS